MKSKPTLLSWEEEIYRTSKGYIVKMKIELWRFSELTSLEYFPEGYKLSWIVYNLENESEKVLFDNHSGKAPHYHVNGKQEFFLWTSLEQAKKLFFQKVEKRFGKLLKF